MKKYAFLIVFVGLLGTSAHNVAAICDTERSTIASALEECSPEITADDIDHRMTDFIKCEHFSVTTSDPEKGRCFTERLNKKPLKNQDGKVMKVEVTIKGKKSK